MDILALCLETITNDIKRRVDPALLNHIITIACLFDPEWIRCLQPLRDTDWVNVAVSWNGKLASASWDKEVKNLGCG